MFVGFMDSEKAYDREVLWQVLKMYDASGKVLSEVKSMFIKSSLCRLKRR